MENTSRYEFWKKNRMLSKIFSLQFLLSKSCLFKKIKRRQNITAPFWSVSQLRKTLTKTVVVVPCRTFGTGLARGYTITYILVSIEAKPSPLDHFSSNRFSDLPTALQCTWYLREVVSKQRFAMVDIVCDMNFLLTLWPAAAVAAT